VSCIALQHGALLARVSRAQFLEFVVERPEVLALYLQQGIARLWRVAHFVLSDFLQFPRLTQTSNALVSSVDAFSPWADSSTRTAQQVLAVLTPARFKRYAADDRLTYMSPSAGVRGGRCSQCLLGKHNRLRPRTFTRFFCRRLRPPTRLRRHCKQCPPSARHALQWHTEYGAIHLSERQPSRLPRPSSSVLRGCGYAPCYGHSPRSLVHPPSDRTLRAPFAIIHTRSPLSPSLCCAGATSALASRGWLGHYEVWAQAAYKVSMRHGQTLYSDGHGCQCFYLAGCLWTPSPGQPGEGYPPLRWSQGASSVLPVSSLTRFVVKR